MSILYYKNLLVRSVGVLLLLVCSTALAKNNANAVVPATNYMFLQNAKSGILKPTAQKGFYQLVLQDVQPYVTYFSDRPQRITGLMSLDVFLKEEWQSKNGFKQDAPNVGIEGIKLHGFAKDQSISLVMVLSNPVYDKNAKTLTYTAHALAAGEPVIKDSIKLEHIALFIDNIGSCPSCCCGFNGN